MEKTTPRKRPIAAKSSVQKTSRQRTLHQGKSFQTTRTMPHSSSGRLQPGRVSSVITNKIARMRMKARNVIGRLLTTQFVSLGRLADPFSDPYSHERELRWWRGAQ